MLVLRLVAFLFAFLPASLAAAQTVERPSTCLAVANALPDVVYASFQPVQATGQGEVLITYAGHSTYIIETPAGVRIATDFSGIYGADPVPDVVTMNKAHSSHHTRNPDPAIEHVLTGWNPDGEGPIEHTLLVEDVYIRNVTTDIRGGFEGMEKDGNSIFIFEVAGLCIGHLGHLHHRLDESHYAAIGRLDVLMVPIDGGLTLSLGAMSEIADRLQSSIVLPMHRFSTPIDAFTAGISEYFDVDFRDTRTLTISLTTLPDRPTVIVLQGV